MFLPFHFLPFLSIHISWYKFHDLKFSFVANKLSKASRQHTKRKKRVSVVAVNIVGDNKNIDKIWSRYMQSESVSPLFSEVQKNRSKNIKKKREQNAKNQKRRNYAQISLFLLIAPSSQWNEIHFHFHFYFFFIVLSISSAAREWYKCEK